MVSTAGSVTFLTPTFGGDRDRFWLQRESMARCGIEIPHVAVVETEDLPMFQSVPWPEGLTIVPTAEVLPRAAERLRRAGRTRWAARLPWNRLAGGRLNGWFSQQLVKLLGGALVGGDWVCLDSDMAFIRPMTTQDFRGDDGRLLLVEIDGLASPEVRAFRHRAEVFFGVEPLPEDSEVHYTSPIAPFSAPTVERALRAVEERGGGAWWRVLREHDLTEYATYGVFARRVDGCADVVPADPRWTWLYYPGDPLTLDQRADALAEDGSFRALMIHSHAGIDADTARAALERAWRHIPSTSR